MKKRQKLLSEEQWQLIEPLLPKPRPRRDKRGRPPAPNRACFEGILWILQTGAAWHFLPDEFPSPSTCWRRLQRWQEEGVWLDAWRALLGGLDEEGLLQWEETFLDGSFAPAKKGAPPSVKPSVARARSGWYWSTVKVFRWIADRAYDSDPLRRRLQKRGIELIAPYRSNNKQRRYEDKRKLRRYKRRWIVERTNAWLGQFRRLLVRHEHLLSTYYAFFYLACFWITLRRYF